MIAFNTQLNAQGVDCEKPNNNEAVNQVTRERIYQHLKLVAKNKSVNQDSITEIAISYINLQTQFNALYAKMMKDKANFASKKLICSRYSTELSSLAKKAEDYDERILKLIRVKKDAQASFGVSDVLDIIDWVFKKFKEGNKKFYDTLAWKDWDDVVKNDSTTASKKS